VRRAGTVTRTAQGLLVVRAEEAAIPDIGSECVDEGLDAVGRIVDVFGPVERPYLAVSPATERADRTALLVGETLYVR
jgi:RNA-binding protein